MVNTRQAGFTLVEVMVAMVIGAIIILGAGQLLLTTVTTFTRVETISRQQEAVIFAAEALTRDVRHGAGHRYEVSQSLVNNNTCALRRNGQPLIEGLYKGSSDCHAVNLFEQDVQGVAGLYRITLRFADSKQAPFIWHVMQRSQVITPTGVSL